MVTSTPAVLLVGMNYSPEVTGIAPYSSGLMTALAGSGLRSRVITTFAHYPQWSFGSSRPPVRESADTAGVRVDRLRHGLPKKPGGAARAASELSFGLGALRTRFGRPDVVILVSPALISSFVAFLKVRCSSRVPVLLWIQDLYTLGLRELDGGRPGTGAKMIARLERWLVRSVDQVVVIHERFKETLVQEFDVAPERVTVIRNWAHLEPFAEFDRASVRMNLGWLPSDFVVLHAGNMGVKQGLENVVEAARLASAAGSSVRFVLMGDGNQRAHLKAISADVPALRWVDSLPDDEFRRALGSADALLVNEKAGVSGMAVPSKLTSYFSTGLPVIAATDPGSVTESEVLSAEAGLSVKAGNPAALLAVAEYLRGEPAVAAQLGTNGRSFREGHLAPEASFDKFIKLIEIMATRNSSAKLKGLGNE